MIEKTKKHFRRTDLLFVLVAVLISMFAAQALAQSQDVAIIGSAAVYNGGTFLTSGGDFDDFDFTVLQLTDVTTAGLANYDTVLLNVSSYGAGTGLYCNVDTLSAQQKADLVSFVANGNKMIIYDSECSTQNYSWLPYPFTTNNPGAYGSTNNTLNIIEENTLSSSDSSSEYYIDAYTLGTYTDAVGDMNVMTTYDPNWCLDMSGTNVLNVTGPVHTYAKYPQGTDAGLIIYNGLDVDYMGYGAYGYAGAVELEEIWLQELQQTFNPSSLPCGHTVVGINLSPATATNPVGTDHTVTATIEELTGAPVEDVTVYIEVISGPNAGEYGSGMTDENGEVSFTYTSDGTPGVDEIEACFMDDQGAEVCSQMVEKIWEEECDLCDFDCDGDVDIDDIMAVSAARGTTDQSMDIDGDGYVTSNDARACVFECTNARCAR